MKEGILMRKDKIQERNAKKKVKKKRVILLTLSAILLFLVGFSGMYAFSFYNKLGKTYTPGFNGDEVNANDDTLKQYYSNLDNITNVALFGLDKVDPNEPGRSDAIMILTIDKGRNKIKLSSIIRDSYVNISGHDKDKITHAYAFGGPKLAVSTLNDTFGLNIKDYISIDFYGLADIVDSLGGLELNVIPEQIKPPTEISMNFHIKEMAMARNLKYTPVEKAGLQTLNGLQAVAYARDRETAGGDFERTERQREVLTKIMEKIKNTNVTKLPSMVDNALKYSATSFKADEILGIGTGLLKSGLSKIDQERFPLDDYSKGISVKGVYYLQFDQTKTKKQICDYIFDDIKPQ
jgi:LCP family protein required for cell wall assembly